MAGTRLAVPLDRVRATGLTWCRRAGPRHGHDRAPLARLGPARRAASEMMNCTANTLSHAVRRCHHQPGSAERRVCAGGRWRDRCRWGAQNCRFWHGPAGGRGVRRGGRLAGACISRLSVVGRRDDSRRLTSWPHANTSPAMIAGSVTVTVALWWAAISVGYWRAMCMRSSASSSWISSPLTSTVTLWIVPVNLKGLA